MGTGFLTDLWSEFPGSLVPVGLTFLGTALNSTLVLYLWLVVCRALGFFGRRSQRNS